MDWDAKGDDHEKVRLAYSSVPPVPIFRYLLGDKLIVPQTAQEGLCTIDLLEPLFVQVAFKRVIAGDNNNNVARTTGNYIKDCFKDGSLTSYSSHCECSFVCIRRVPSDGGGKAVGVDSYVRVSFVVKYGYPLQAVMDKAYPPDTWVVLDFGSLTRPQLMTAYRRNLQCLGVLNRSDQRTCSNIHCCAVCCDQVNTVVSCSCGHPSIFCQTLTVTESVYAALVVCGNGWVSEYFEKPVSVPFCGDDGDSSSVSAQTHLTCSGATFMTFHDMFMVVGAKNATPRCRVSGRLPTQEDRWSSPSSSASSSSPPSSSASYSCSSSRAALPSRDVTGPGTLETSARVAKGTKGRRGGNHTSRGDPYRQSASAKDVAKEKRAGRCSRGRAVLRPPAAGAPAWPAFSRWTTAAGGRTSLGPREGVPQVLAGPRAHRGRSKCRLLARGRCPFPSRCRSDLGRRRLLVLGQ
jgi:hypothetical protein